MDQNSHPLPSEDLENVVNFSLTQWTRKDKHLHTDYIIYTLYFFKTELKGAKTIKKLNRQHFSSSTAFQPIRVLRWLCLVTLALASMNSRRKWKGYGHGYGQGNSIYICYYIYTRFERIWKHQQKHGYRKSKTPPRLRRIYAAVGLSRLKGMGRKPSLQPVSSPDTPKLPKTSFGHHLGSGCRIFNPGVKKSKPCQKSNLRPTTLNMGIPACHATHGQHGATRSGRQGHQLPQWCVHWLFKHFDGGLWHVPSFLNHMWSFHFSGGSNAPLPHKKRCNSHRIRIWSHHFACWALFSRSPKKHKHGALCNHNLESNFRCLSCTKGTLSTTAEDTPFCGVWLDEELNCGSLDLFWGFLGYVLDPRICINII